MLCSEKRSLSLCCYMGSSGKKQPILCFTEIGITPRSVIKHKVSHYTEVLLAACLFPLPLTAGCSSSQEASQFRQVTQGKPHSLFLFTWVADSAFIFINSGCWTGSLFDHPTRPLLEKLEGGCEQQGRIEYGHCIGDQSLLPSFGRL